MDIPLPSTDSDADFTVAGACGLVHDGGMVLGVALALLMSQVAEVKVEIVDRHFAVRHVDVPAGASLRIENRDNEVFTIESPGAFSGDVMVERHSSAVVKPVRGGEFVVMIEEQPDSELAMTVASDPQNVPPADAPFDVAKALGRQAVDATLRDPGYGAITRFRLAGTGQEARQSVLIDVYRLSEELSMLTPPEELALFFEPGQWEALRSSVSLVVGLGPSAYDPVRFGSAVARTKPLGLHEFAKAKAAHAEQVGGYDLMVRVSSDSAWFNLRVCRLLWLRLGKRISTPTLEWGYANPNGRSPLLGGFFDGTGNPGGDARMKALFTKEGGSYLAYFKIRFDEDRFRRLGLAGQEQAVGRERESGKSQQFPDIWAHRVRAFDGKNAMVRMPLVFDEGPGRTGLLFLAGAASLKQVDTLLAKMLQGLPGERDRLLGLMHFEEAGYYYLPPSPLGSYPGALTAPSFGAAGSPK